MNLAESRPASGRSALFEEASTLLRQAEPAVGEPSRSPGTDPRLAPLLQKQRARLQGLR